MAKQFSQGPNAAEGGKIGWIEERSLSPFLKHAISTIDKNEVSNPIRTDDSYYLIKLHERKVTDVEKKIPEKEKVKELLLLKKIDLETRKFTRNLHDNSYIEIRI